MTSKSSFDILAEIMRSRHSVKRYKEESISREELEEILRLTATAPSSWNLQHWRYIPIVSKEMKERILPIAYYQKQVVEASCTIVILGDLEANKSAPEVYTKAVEEGSMSQSVQDTLIKQIEGAYANSSTIARDEAICNASLAAMQLMLIARAKGYDTCPMGGFNRESLVKALNIPQRYLPVMLVTVGTAAEPGRPSSRFDIDKTILNHWYE